MENAIWLVIAAAVFVALVVGGFWVIKKAELNKIVAGLFGGIVLIVIVFALVYLARNQGFIKG